MSETKKKKKHAEAILLYSENQAFLDGTIEHPVNARQLKNNFAARHFLSYEHKLENRILKGVIAILLTTGAYYLLLHIFGFAQFPGHEFSSLPGKLMLVVLAFLLFSIAFLSSVQAVNYRPNKVNKLYSDWLNSARLVNGTIRYTSVNHRTITAYPGDPLDMTVFYSIFLEDGKKIRGSYQIKQGEIKTSLKDGTPIYILYADRKLHAPL